MQTVPECYQRESRRIFVLDDAGEIPLADLDLSLDVLRVAVVWALLNSLGHDGKVVIDLRGLTDEHRS